MSEARKRTFYICYFGLREPLVQTQVLPYLREISNSGIDVSLLTFEPELKKTWDPDSIAAARAEMQAKAIDWHCLAYHKRPSAIATAFDIVNGVRFIRRHIREFDVLHGRVHVATLMGALARRLSSHKPKLIFDIRGFFPEEYVDAGIWPENGILYRAAKRAERWLMKEADGFVVLTEKARNILFGEPHSGLPNPRSIEVIPCCVDLKRFDAIGKADRDALRHELGVDDRRVLVYVGSFGGWYLTDEMIDFFAVARDLDPSTFVMVLTQRGVEAARNTMRAAGFGDSDMLVTSVPPAELPRYLNAADVGISFIKPCYSKQASSPTKNAEYLAAGLPIIANAGIGDVDKMVEENGVGVVIEKMEREAYVDAIHRLDSLGDVRERCRETARREFDLATVGGPRYVRLYRALLDE